MRESCKDSSCCCLRSDRDIGLDCGLSIIFPRDEGPLGVFPFVDFLLVPVLSEDLIFADEGSPSRKEGGLRETTTTEEDQ